MSNVTVQKSMARHCIIFHLFLSIVRIGLRYVVLTMGLFTNRMGILTTAYGGKSFKSTGQL